MNVICCAVLLQKGYFIFRKIIFAKVWWPLAPRLHALEMQLQIGCTVCLKDFEFLYVVWFILKHIVYNMMSKAAHFCSLKSPCGTGGKILFTAFLKSARNGLSVDI